ncbi:MAG: filamentous hemagglutinin N-terminal domain-containing protein, partial [Methylococcaceae bacterium]
ESATFSGSAGIKNVISRVTGGQASTIDGVFRSTIPNANVYFLNPSGVIFGENASLDVQGSFHASTANYLKFKDGVKFETGVKTANPILTTASPEAFGFLNNSPASISVSGGNNKLLQVPDNKTLSLIGGDISIEDRSLYAPGGQIILASTGSAGEVVFNNSGIDTSSFTQGGNIHISHAANNPIAIIGNNQQIADIDVSADSAGKVVIRGGQMVMDNSFIQSNTTNGNGKGIDIGLKGDLTMNGIPESPDKEKSPRSWVTANSLGEGDSGNIVLNVDNLKLTQGSRISSLALSSGNGGDVTINSNTLILEGNDSNTVPILTTGTVAAGHSGNLTINNTDKLTVNKGASIDTFTKAKGNTGEVLINTASLDIHDGSKVSNTVTETAEGNSADLTINASGSINLSNNSNISNNTDGKGSVKHLIINADSISLSDKSNIQSITNGQGNTGNLTINTNALKVKNGNILNHTNNSGNAGDLTINAGSLEVFNGKVGSDSGSKATGGNGNIDIKANNILLEGNSFSTKAEISGSIEGNQKTGNLTIIADKLEINDWAGIRMDNDGTGNTGDLFIEANEILMSNTAGGIHGISADLNDTGDSGNLTIKSKNLVMLNGAEISISNKGSGDSGFLSVEVVEDIVLNGTSIFLNDDSLVINSSISNKALSSGKVNNTFLSAKNILLNDSAQISTNSTASSDAGDLFIKADQLVMQDLSRINTGSLSAEGAPLVSGKGGNLEINTDYLDMDNAFITTLNKSEKNGGDIKIHAIDIKLNNVSIISTSTIGAGKAGNLTIDVDNNLLLNRSILATASPLIDLSSTQPETAKSGDIKITANGQIRLENQSGITSFTEKANAGTIIINGEAPLQLHDNSIILTSVSDGQGQGGDIFIDNPIVALDYSTFNANAVKGFGGNITISGFLFNSPRSVITASSTLNADGELNLKPETNISGNLAILPESLLNAAEHFSDRCVSRSEKNKNSFVIKNRGGVPLSPGELSPANFLDYLSPESNDVLPETKSHSKTNVLLSYNNMPCTQ